NRPQTREKKTRDLERSRVFFASGERRNYFAPSVGAGAVSVPAAGAASVPAAAGAAAGGSHEPFFAFQTASALTCVFLPLTSQFGSCFALVSFARATPPAAREAATRAIRTMFFMDNS